MIHPLCFQNTSPFISSLRVLTKEIKHPNDQGSFQQQCVRWKDGDPNYGLYSLDKSLIAFFKLNFNPFSLQDGSNMFCPAPRFNQESYAAEQNQRAQNKFSYGKSNFKIWRSDRNLLRIVRRSPSPSHIHNHEVGCLHMALWSLLKVSFFCYSFLRFSMSLFCVIQFSKLIFHDLPWAFKSDFPHFFFRSFFSFFLSIQKLITYAGCAAFWKFNVAE